uniref:Putative secreted protein n=1 Tax=Haematobia irritans TaxID=7368 RepID=A0A1L8EDK7_HAEIR
MKTLLVIVAWFCLATLSSICWSLPVLDSSSGIDNQTIEELKASLNDTPKNLYVVKAVVYEIGILTEVGENDTSFESQERVDLTFFDAHTNNSFIDLGNIPLPIQTNVSGQVLTGIAPYNVGAFSSPSELLQSLPLTGSIVNITHSDTAYYQLTKSNITDDAKPKVIDPNQVNNLSKVASLFPSARLPPIVSQSSKADDSSNSVEED